MTDTTPSTQAEPQQGSTDEWVTLGNLPPGALFETRTGIQAIKSEYHYPNGQCECVLLASGEYAHYPDGNLTLVREISIDRLTRELEAARRLSRRDGEALRECTQTVVDQRAELEAARQQVALTKACANGFALDALKALREMTGSDNNDNPWLGVTAAVALLQSDLDDARARLAAVRVIVKDMLNVAVDADDRPMVAGWWYRQRLQAAFDAAREDTVVVHHYSPPTTDPHIPDVRNCGCTTCCAAREGQEGRA